MGTFQIRYSAPGTNPVVSAPIVVSPASALSTTIALSLHRLSAGTGVTRVVTGIPLQAGHLSVANLTANNLSVWVGGVQVPVTFVDHKARHSDGTVKAVGIHFDTTLTFGAAAVAAELRLTTPRTAGAASGGATYAAWVQATDTPTNPAGVALCTPDHYCATRVLGPLRTRAAVNALALSSPTDWSWCKTHLDNYETEYEYWWTQSAEKWDANGAGRGFATYDHIWMAWQWHFMTGTLETWRRARMMGVNFAHDFLPLLENTAAVDPLIREFWSDGFDFLATYLMTGEPNVWNVIGRLGWRATEIIGYFSFSDLTGGAACIGQNTRQTARYWSCLLAAQQVQMTIPPPVSPGYGDRAYNPGLLNTLVADLLGGSPLSPGGPSNPATRTWATCQNTGTVTPGTHIADESTNRVENNQPNYGFPQHNGGSNLSWNVGGVYPVADWNGDKTLAGSRTAAKSYMDAFLALTLSKHYDWYGADAKIITCLQRLVTFWYGDGNGSGLWRKGRPSTDVPHMWGMSYLSDGYDDTATTQVDGKATVQPLQNGHYVEAPSWLYEKTGDVQYRNIADAFAIACAPQFAVRANYFTNGERRLDELYFHAFNHLGRR